jgi:enoyl-CoA hydratase/carnithine racemase
MVGRVRECLAEIEFDPPAGDFVEVSDTAMFVAAPVLLGFGTDGGLTWNLPGAVGLCQAKDAATPD